MLKIWLGSYMKEVPRALGKTDGYFDSYFDKEKITTEFSRRVIFDILDGATVFDKNVIVHPVFGGLTVSQLPTGIKTIFTAVYDDSAVVNLTYCGDNCIPYLLQEAESRDILVSSTRMLRFYLDEGCFPKGIYIMNEDIVVDNFEDYAKLWFKHENDVIK